LIKLEENIVLYAMYQEMYIWIICCRVCFSLPSL